jgi:hypothetical protein
MAAADDRFRTKQFFMYGRTDIFVTVLIMAIGCCANAGLAADFQLDVKPLLGKYCVECHSGDEANADVDFAAIKTNDDVATAFETWESVVNHLKARTMPPADEPQPTNDERERVYSWYRGLVETIEARPAEFKPRRLSVTEYRNTLRSLFGFDLQVAVIEAEQTLSERSMVLKLLPPDPPGQSGFKNDTHNNPLTTNAWEQYSYLSDVALDQLFSDERRSQLESFTGPIDDAGLTTDQAQRLLQTFFQQSRRRVANSQDLAKIAARVDGKTGSNLIEVTKFEMKTILMSPGFLYRGLLMPGSESGRQPVDAFELAERMSYFIWSDMPDEQLMSRAADGTLTAPDVYAAELDRLLASPKALSLAEVFATEWLSLGEIEHVSDNPPLMVALKSQPIDFMHYLFTEDRPLLEMIDSKTAFINPHTSRMYGADAKQMTRYVKQKGIEVEIVPNQKITLETTTERGGLLTMPGVLAMNKGPILRGTWLLERILGEDLPEPPANIGQVPPNDRGEHLTFRQRFEQHRDNATCAICHDKIDPLGFALQSFDNQGKYLKSKNYKPSRKQKRKGKAPDLSSKIDTSGKLPSGETFKDFAELKTILTTSQRHAVIRNIVERTMSYALSRKLKIYDQPTVTSIVGRMNETDGTWRDLFHAVANSIPFRETIISK